jgi:hypothetical protein
VKPPPRLLWLLALAVGLWFARERLLPSDVVEADTTRARPSAGATPRPAPARSFDPASAEVCATPAVMPERGPIAADGAGDPFTPPRPVESRKPPVAVVVQAPLAPPPPAPPPPLRVPYKLLGALSEQGASSSVFLALGNAVITAKAGDVLEGGFRLESITPRELTFLHLQLNQTVRLPVDGDPL